MHGSHTAHACTEALAHVLGLRLRSGTIKMGKSSSKLKRKQEIAVNEVVQGESDLNTNHVQSATEKDPSAKAGSYRLSSRGKRTSFYEMVDANEVLPYLIVGK